MAIRNMAVVYMMVLLLLLVGVLFFEKCGNGCGTCMVVEEVEAPPKNNQIRKLLLHGEDDQEVFKGGFGSLDSHHEKDVVGWDLRKAPSGPDPLHHNGGSPNNKPRTP